MKITNLTLHKHLVFAFFTCLLLLVSSFIHMSNAKPVASIKWLDVIGEGGIAVITLCWLIVTLYTRPKGKLTTLLFIGISMVHFSMLLDLLDEFFRYKNEYAWFSRLEAIPAVLGLVMMSFALYYWHKEQQIINNRLIKSERFYREHSFYDMISGLYSASYMKKQIAAELVHFNTHNTPFCISVFDIKSFNLYLREQGRLSANKLLHDIASLIQVNIRDSDLACRYAGDRFIVLMPNTKQHQAQVINTHVANMVKQHVLYFDNKTLFNAIHQSSIEVTRGDDVTSLLMRLNHTLTLQKQVA